MQAEKLSVLSTASTAPAASEQSSSRAGKGTPANMMDTSPDTDQTPEESHAVRNKHRRKQAMRKMMQRLAMIKEKERQWHERWYTMPYNVHWDRYILPIPHGSSLEAEQAKYIQRIIRDVKRDHWDTIRHTYPFIHASPNNANLALQLGLIHLL
jgi:hypothetical protein